jgi:calcineurin-like phosphoesterase family protein
MFIYKDKEYDRVWFTSDEHYGSDRHIALSCRLGFEDPTKEKQIERYKQTLCNTEIPETLKHHMLMMFKHSVYGSVFETPVSKMNDLFIKNHNARVGDNDIVFHVGDFGDYEYAKYLNGHHILIMGNYEAKDMADNYNHSFEEFRNKIISTYNFIDVCMDYMLELDDNNKNNIKFSHLLSKEVGEIFITHQPTFCYYNYKDDEYVKSTYNDGKIIMNLFGHIHEKCKIKRCGLNVGIDGHHFYPVSQEEVDFYLYAILHHYDKEVFC